MLNRLSSKIFTMNILRSGIMTWNVIYHEQDSVVISYGHIEPLNTIMELKHMYQVFCLGAIRAHMPNSGAVWRRLSLKRDGTKHIQLTKELVFIVLSVETEEHVLLVRSLYDDLRHRLLSSIYEEFPYFDNLSNDQKL